MPAIPVTATIQSNGSRATSVPTDKVVVMGTSSSGTDTEIVAVSSTAALQSEFGVGPLVQLAALYLQTQRVIYCQRINDSVAAAMSAVTAAPVGAETGTVTDNASAPVDAFDVIIEIISTGTVALTSFTWRYSLDGGDNWSGVLQGAATATLGSSGISVTFADGAGPTTGFADGGLYTFTTTAPGYVSADLEACYSALVNDSLMGPFLIHPATTSVVSTTLYSGIRTGMTNLETAYKYGVTLIESDDVNTGGGETVAQWQTAVAGTDFATESNRCAVIAGWHEVTMALPIGNDSLQLRRPHAWVAGPRLADIDISEDPGAVEDGSLDNAVLDTVSASNPTGLLADGLLYAGFEDRGFTTCQTYRGLSGIYCGGGFMRVQPSNDFYRIAHRRVMDMACSVLVPILTSWVNTNVATNADGTILESEAQAKEAVLNRAIETALVNTKPQRISPASDGSYAVIDRTNVITTTENLIVTVGLISRPFIGSVTLFIGYTLEIPVSS